MRQQSKKLKILIVLAFFQIQVGQSQTNSATKRQNKGSLANCLNSWASPLGSRGFFSSDSQTYYHLAQLPWPPGQKTQGIMQRKYGLFQADLKTSRARLLFSLNLPSTLAVIPQQDPLVGIIAVMFNDPTNRCLQGKARFVGIPIQHSGHKKPKLRVIPGRADIRILGAPGSQVIYDHERQASIEFDFKGLQTRANRLPVSPFETPVFLDPDRGRYYVWREKNGESPQGLIAYESLEKSAGKVQFQTGDKLLHQGNYFGALEILEQSNSLKVIELKRWSGVSTTQSFKVHIPLEIPVAKTQVRANFKKSVLTVRVANPLSLEHAKVLYIFDYRKAWKIGVREAALGEYLDDEIISPNGSHVLIAHHDSITGDTTAISIFSVSDRHWVKIRFNQKP